MNSHTLSPIAASIAANDPNFTACEPSPAQLDAEIAEPREATPLEIANTQREWAEGAAAHSRLRLRSIESALFGLCLGLLVAVYAVVLLRWAYNRKEI